MIRTGKRLFAILMALCLVAALLPTAALASEAKATISVEPNSFTAGTAASGTITVTANNGKFETDLTGKITVSENASELGLTIDGLSRTSDTTATFNVSGTPTKKGTITVTATKEAFQTEGQPEASVTAEISVKEAPAPTVTASAEGLVAGQDATGKNITLTIN